MSKDLPKIYQLTVNQNQLEMIGGALSQVGAKLNGDIQEMFDQDQIMRNMVKIIGPQQYAEDLQSAITQVAKLDGIDQCPNCGDYHIPKEDEDAQGNVTPPHR